MNRYVTRVRVRHYEMDSLGHVNNAVYLNYLEHAAIEHSEQLGFSLKRYQELNGAFVLRRMEIDYRRAAVAGDCLEITTWLGQMRGPRAIRHYEIRKQGEPDLLVTAEALWVWIDRASMRPQAIPNVLLQSFQAQTLKQSDLINQSP